EQKELSYTPPFVPYPDRWRTNSPSFRTALWLRAPDAGPGAWREGVLGGLLPDFWMARTGRSPRSAFAGMTRLGVVLLNPCHSAHGPAGNAHRREGEGNGRNIGNGRFYGKAGAVRYQGDCRI